MTTKYSIKAIKDLGKLSEDGVCVYDLVEQKFAYVNKSFLKILETSRPEIDTNPAELIKYWIGNEREHAERYFTDMMMSLSIQDIEFRIKFEGREKFVSISAFVLNENKIVMVIIKDITSSREHFNYIVEFGARKDALLDMVAHNLSGPLNLTTNLLNAIDQLNRDNQYQKVDEFSRLIRESTHQCIEIINSFLHEEHTESERVVVKYNLFDANKKVKVITERIKQFNQDKQIQIHSNRSDIMVRADDVKFFQIVHNLLSNAVKFTKVSGEIMVNIVYHEDYFDLTVTDNGIGIPEHLQSYIFQRNTPASREGVRGEKSIGLGLYIVKKLTEMMRGEVSFKSEENVGSSFTIRLPRQ